MAVVFSKCEKIGVEVIVAYFKVLSQNSPEGTEQNENRMFTVLVGIPTGYLLNTSQKCYCVNHVAW
jgi:hypothetical protein